jgi:hypothetical protein
MSEMTREHLEAVQDGRRAMWTIAHGWRSQEGLCAENHARNERHAKAADDTAARLSEVAAMIEAKLESRHE